MRHLVMQRLRAAEPAEQVVETMAMEGEHQKERGNSQQLNGNTLKEVVVEEHYADSEHHRTAEEDHGKEGYTKYVLGKPREVVVAAAIL